MKWRPFIEWRPHEIGIGFSLAVDHELAYVLGPVTKDASERVWIPNIWLHLGPVVVGIGVQWGGLG